MFENAAMMAQQCVSGKIPKAEQLRMEAQQAVYILEQARKIRAQPELMTEIRLLLHEQRDQMATLLDDLAS